MRILGLDPGLRVTGYGVIDHHRSALTYVASGSIKTVTDTLPARLKMIFEGVCEVIDRYQPEQVAIENVFVNINPKSTLLLGQARGVAIAAAVHKQLPVAEYTALQIKQGVVGYGHAQKAQIQNMVMRLLQLPTPPATDPADALACAIRHANEQGNPLLPPRLKGLKMRHGRLVSL
ncbi:MAG: crossover junction endodeoxyribonuclease RuvC [Ferrovum sp. 37-45-19]|uniref:crossover junction endodeoxyribonuclease RuvC n=1 Tax=Ferrovum sp. JA12 TaxID=1356299 RepID=UPI00070361B6|nr:crossover junction endodeoxyribonuclease RuvC [Ferrovum sp. JA12]OYV80107.1 MAG: crossover junction endodeoxyribonuclease RuvC [Ferrovum sp. 21-44-67]OYV93332.1 MAG: crossover junction endodeoxyribonuclease RuvC [Ferrovum sp. 37-45-19]OZB33532.1 MAG: crossover junction endodeoxyribonuclease RuvC [Ferrovum sp. 34-44-207]